MPERFWAKVQPCPMSGCWLWSGYLNEKGYGMFRHGPMRMAHRVAYEILVGGVAGGLCLDHKCRVRCCTNPSHLEPVTPLENTRRGDVRRAECKHGHEKPPGKRCPECHRQNERKRRARRRGGQ